MPLTRLIIPATVLYAILLTSCGQDSRVPPLETQVTKLESQVNNLDSKVTTLEAEVKQLNEQISMSKVFKDIEGIAFMTPGTDGYSIIKSDLGSLTVSLTNIQPYANGSKVTLQFGNLTAATIDGLKTTLEWGSLDKDGLPNNQEAKSREVIFNESLPSGSWTNSQVVLEGIPPIELGFVRLRDVGHRGVKLRR